MSKSILIIIGLFSFLIVVQQIDSEAGTVTSNWDGDSVFGSTALDPVGENDGAISSGVTIVPGPDGAGDDAFGFNGISDIIVPDHDSLDVGTSDFSIDLWVRQTGFNSPEGIHTMIDKRNSPTDPSTPNDWLGYVIYSYHGKPSIQLSGGSLGYTNFNASEPVLIDGLWHHIIFTVDRDNPVGGVFYIDGTPDTSIFDPTTYSGSLNNESVFRIGRRNNLTSNWIGDLDRIHLYSRVITPEEVEDVANGGSLGDPDAVAVDIRPKHCPNKLKIKGDDDSSSDDKSSGGKKANLKVAILGTQEFDVRTIDVTTLNINGVTPVKSKFKDVTAPSALEPCDCERLPKDTYEDLELKFNRQDIIATLGTVQDGDAIELTLAGNLLEAHGGGDIEGKDCVLIDARGDGNSGSGHKKKKKHHHGSDDDSRSGHGKKK
jgi:hypothetical protein